MKNENKMALHLFVLGDFVLHTCAYDRELLDRYEA